MQYKKKKIYISGISGFVGSRIAKMSLNEGYQVIGISRKSISSLSRELGIKIIEADFNDKNKLVLEEAEAIVHCATANEVVSKNLSQGLSLSIFGTNKLLEASRAAKISNVIFFSTAQVYGTNLSGYFDETSPVDCKSSYGINNYLGEELCKYYCNTQGFNIVVLRPSNVFGVPEVSTVNRKTLVPMSFVDEAINKGSITLNSSGKQTRNFISIDKLAKFTLETVENFPKGFSLRNCGSNFYPSILEIANIVSKQYEKNYKKKLVINLKSDKPVTSNFFEYKSKFEKFSNTKEDCRKKMELTINQLFQMWKNNQKIKASKVKKNIKSNI